VVATDASEVAGAARDFGAHAVLTSADHPSGTDRVAEAAAMEPARSCGIVVNYQADEPFVDPGAVSRAVSLVAGGDAALATVAAPVEDPEEWRSPAVVKVVTREDGRALYFSRSPIPHPREGEPRLTGDDDTSRDPYHRHVGVYVYERRALRRWVELPPSPLERIERLEQLRALESGMEIQVVVGPATEPGVDVPDDLKRARRILAGENPQRDDTNG
jgi:3-deoxy-manno-octulosonate cytidylyltransferase (CMP-KDO synthetase)